jgi:hypothetical protein
MSKCKIAKVPLPKGLKVWDDPDFEFVDAE